MVWFCSPQHIGSSYHAVVDQGFWIGGLIAAHFSFNPFKNVSYPSAQKKKRISKIYEIIAAY